MVNTVCANGDQFGINDGRLELLTGCGLEFPAGGSGLTLQGVLPWPYDCTMELHGGRIYCDGETLRTAPPDRFGVFEHTNFNDLDIVLGIGDQRVVTNTFDIDLTNGHCEDVLAVFAENVEFTVSTADSGTSWRVTTEVSIDGGPTLFSQAYRESNTAVPRQMSDRRDVRQRSAILAGGATHTIVQTVRVQNIDTTAGNQITCHRLDGTVTGFYNTRRP